ncbi:peptidoglycan D,D-transpeptidase FtsI family protein [Paenibacillus koleovorans]|uniref:peptidoglycan D,D-transpeptidase FtsI family protein n=1 Tax=Paenibacillus koleovorans TaxID=121608 RepID=UPI001FE73D3A|nr:penicillin-binding protein 2 [Paenibacillus koleovorans]
MNHSENPNVLSLHRRVLFGLLVIAVMFAFLLWKLMRIQVLDTGSYTAHEVDLVRDSVAQRETGIELDSGRGQFYDRNGMPITGQIVKALVVFPLKPMLSGREGDVAKLLRVIGTDQKTWESFYHGLRQPRIWGDGLSGQPKPLTEAQAEQITALQLPGVKVFETMRRYPADAVAKQLIGYVGENPQRIATMFARELENGQLSITSRIGVAGLEKTLESYLQGIGHTSISQFTDAESRPLPGMESRLVTPDNPYYPLQARTTLDLPLQRQVEAVLDRLRVREGAVVVLDASNADVLAMASRPDYDPGRVDPSGTGWSNRALKAFAPGSIFKTVVAAAALEEGVLKPGERFHCSGSLGKYGFTCWLKQGHGDITLQEAFAVSCNVTFAKVAQRLTGSQLQQYAEKLGLDRKVGWSEGPGAKADGGSKGGSKGSSSGERQAWSQFDAEEQGQIFDGRQPSEDEGVRVQTAIGQRDVLVSPLQAANLVVTLLNRGVVHQPRAVTSIQFRSGSAAAEFPERVLLPRGDGISASTAKKLTGWMQDVVRDGTGKALQQAKWPLAGKSGTAEVTAGGKPAVNQWFIGYGPADKPRYAVAVVVPHANDREGGLAIAAFRDVMDALAEREQASAPPAAK